MTRQGAVLLGALMLLVSAPAAAGPMKGFLDKECHYQWDIDSALGERSAEDRKRFAGGALRYCRNDETGTLYLSELLEAPRKDDVGLCFFGEWLVPLERKGNGYVIPKDRRIEYPGNGVRMQRRDGVCPRQDDEGYIANSGVPDGLFLMLLTLWEDILRSPQAFDAALAKDATGDIAAFRDALSESRAADRLHLSVMRAGNLSQVYGLRQKGPALPLEWAIDSETGPYSVRFDWRDGALKIVAVGAGKY